MSDVLGTISSDWAEGIGGQVRSIWEYNGFNAEEIQRDVTLAYLAELSVRFGIRIVTPDDVRALKASQGVINLAFEKPGRVTTTGKLLEASQEQRGENHVLTRELLVRSRPSGLNNHSGNEVWVIPDAALTIVGEVGEIALEEQELAKK